ncbi:MAG: MerR family transcriptional regulator [Lachnospiraceae bacterium]|nr:MerR family transcriptional regulator [Lachnospiraceae bacterium]
MESTRYMISDAANLVNVESHVLRYWEDELDLDIPRNEMGHRYYTEENIKEFFRIKEWKEQGYQLKAIRMLVQEERMKKMAANKNTQNTQLTAGNTNAAGNQLMAGEPVHKEEISNNSARNTVKLEQFQSMMTNIVRNALEENNQALGREVGYQVEEKVIKEMNYLMRVQDEAEEERFRKLDAAIRTHRKGKKIKEDNPQKVGRFSRKEKKLNPNLSM